MKVHISGSPMSVGLQPVKSVPYILISELQLTVDLVLVPVVNVLVNTPGSYTIYFVNRSAGGQTVRIGTAPSFVAGAIAGISLLATDTWMLWNVGRSIFAISDIAGALLDVSVWYQD